MLAKRPAGIILSGGPASVHADDAKSMDAAVFDAGVPVLGICYGAQLVAQQLGGEVRETGSGEYGRTELTRSGRSSVLFEGLPVEQAVWMSHGDAIVSAPEGFVVTASTPDTPAAVSRRSSGASTACSSTPVAHATRRRPQAVPSTRRLPDVDVSRSSRPRSRRSASRSDRRR
jgi:GMP synthase (glutamine-hydrolysing) A subunit